MFDKLKGTVEGIKERAKEIADDTSADNARKHNEERMAAEAAQNEAREATKERLTGTTATAVIGLSAKVVAATNSAARKARAVGEAISVEPPTSTKAPKGLPISEEDESEDKCKPEPLTAKVPEWM